MCDNVHMFDKKFESFKRPKNYIVMIFCNKRPEWVFGPKFKTGDHGKSDGKVVKSNMHLFMERFNVIDLEALQKADRVTDLTVKIGPIESREPLEFVQKGTQEYIDKMNNELEIDYRWDDNEI